MRDFLVLIFFSQFIWAQQYTLTEAEYFWGPTDPGNGQGISISASDGTFNSAVEELITNYNVTQTDYGPTLFNIRVKDANGSWGPTFRKIVFIGGVTQTSQKVKISAFEYYFGNFDPGEGGGTPIVAFDGSLDSAVEEVFRNKATWDVATGPILFNIRAKDSDGKWGPVFKKTIFPYGANTDAQLIAEGDSIEVCPGSEVTLTYNGPFGYTPTWFDGSQENTITFTPTQEGSVSCSATLNGITYTDSIEINFKPQPDATISPSGTVLICSSSNFTIDALVNANYSYQWYLNGNEITNATNASYLPTALGSYTVGITDSATGCSKISEPTVLTSTFEIDPSGNSEFCKEQVLIVPIGYSNTYQWQKDGNDISGATSNIFTATESGVYTCNVNNGSCNFTTSATTLNLTAEQPTADTNQVFNSGETLADLIVTGTNLQWYANGHETNTIPSSTPLVSETTYYVSQTIDGCESNRLAISVTETLGVGYENLNVFRLYPNPTKDKLYFNSSQVINRIKIYNNLGQLIVDYSLNDTNAEINLSSLEKGIYFIKINNQLKFYSVIKN
jgi:hypothetical protein